MKRKEEYDLLNESPKKKQRNVRGTIFDELDAVPPNFRGNKEVRNCKANGTHFIYDVNNINDLVDKERKASGKTEVKLRFLLTVDYKLLFAEEGPPCARIPAHFQMTGCSQDQAECITAGNIKINVCNEIYFINNKSGDFRPSWQSLQYAIAALLANKISFTEELIFEKHENVIERFLIKKQRIVNEITGRFSQEDNEHFMKCNVQNRIEKQSDNSIFMFFAEEEKKSIPKTNGVARALFS